MPQSEDVVNLFQQFGGQADGYQEIAKQEQAQRSRERWPLLNALTPDAATALPPAQPGPAQASAPLDFSPAPRAPEALPPQPETPPRLVPHAEQPAPLPAAQPPAAAPAWAPPPPPPAPAPIAPTVAPRPNLPPVATVQVAPVVAPAPVLAPPAPPAIPTPPLKGGLSPLARLGQHATEPPAAAPEAASPALQGLFDRLAHRTPAAAPAPDTIDQLWKRLGGRA